MLKFDDKTYKEDHMNFVALKTEEFLSTMQ